jgi:PAB-dependent poly(A)-specific ribonuclease subunit 2
VSITDGTTCILLTSTRPLSSVGMPYYREQLLSAWPSHMIFEIGAPPQKIDPVISSQLKVTEWGGWARKTRTNVKRNQVENTRATEKTSTSLQAPKFLSEKARETANDSSMDRRISDVADAIGVVELSSMKAEVPVMYRNVEIKYSKFGVDDFDFG